jgi:hypothetical protein
MQFVLQNPDRCKYYRWQKDYLDDLIGAKVIQVLDHDLEHENPKEGQFVDFQPLAQEAVPKKKDKQDVEAKLDIIVKLVCVLFVLVVAIIGMILGRALK